MHPWFEKLPSPSDPSPRWLPLEVRIPNDTGVIVRDDAYSDRIRCDHPKVGDGAALGAALLEVARSRARGRVMVLAPDSLQEGLERAGLQKEARLPGFYAGKNDCVAMACAVDPCRGTSSNAEAVAHVDDLMQRNPPARPRIRVMTQRATQEHAPMLARLIAATFEHYPTPSGVAEYVAKQIEEGIPFRFVASDGEILACASADLEREAKTAELTDCATRPEHRGAGYMQFILSDLMDDLRAMGYPTAFTLARAEVPGVNLAFQRLGFTFCGRMVRSCRIGGGIEDMNVWSRWL